MISVFEEVVLLEELKYLDKVKLGHKKIYFFKKMMT